MRKISLLIWLAMLATAAIRPDVRAQDRPQGNIPTIDGTMPSFEGGTLDNFREWFDKAWRKELKRYRKEHKKSLRKSDLCDGAVVFTIDTTGRARLEKVLPATMHPSQAEVIRRTLAKSPLWKPGTQRGRKVKVSFTLPFRVAQTDLQPKPEPIR